MKKDTFFNAASLKIASIEVEGLSEPVVVRELTAGQRGEMAKLSQDGSSPVELQCRVIVMACIDPELSVDDVPKLLGMGADVIDTLSDQILQLSGLVEKKDNLAEKNIGDAI